MTLSRTQERFRDLLLALIISIILGAVALVPVYPLSEWRSWNTASFLVSWMSLLSTVFIAALGWVYSRESSEQAGLVGEVTWLLSSWDMKSCTQACTKIKTAIYPVGGPAVDLLSLANTHHDALVVEKQVLNDWAQSVFLILGDHNSGGDDEKRNRLEFKKENFRCVKDLPLLYNLMVHHAIDCLLCAEPLNCALQIRMNEPNVHEDGMAAMLAILDPERGIAPGNIPDPGDEKKWGKIWKKMERRDSSVTFITFFRSHVCKPPNFAGQLCWLG